MPMFRRVMPESDFWALIDVMGGESDDTALERLTEALERSGEKSARAFQERLAAVLHDLDREVLAMQPVRFEDEEDEDEPIPLSDDSFLYLRAGLVTRGRDAVAAVVADPTILAQGRWRECEELLYVAEEVVGDEIETKVSYESGSNERHWSPRPDAGPPEGWTPPLVLVDGEDRDDPIEGGISHQDGAFEEIIDYLPRHTFDGADVVRSSVGVAHATARSWPKAQRGEMVEALAAHAALLALPHDHGARPELESLAGHIELG